MPHARVRVPEPKTLRVLADEPGSALDKFRRRRRRWRQFVGGVGIALLDGVQGLSDVAHCRRSLRSPQAAPNNRAVWPLPCRPSTDAEVLSDTSQSIG